MAKHARKKQRTSKHDKDNVLPLGTTPALNDVGKDDEERRLESLLFGVPYIESKGKGKEVLIGDDDEDDDEDDEDDGHGKEFEGMLDEDLFFVDDATPARPQVNADFATGFGDDLPEASGSGSEHASGDETSDSESGSDTEPDHSRPPKPPSKPSRKAAWHDPADSALTVSLTAQPRLRKLRQTPMDAEVGGREYERRLRAQFEAINPTPSWATNARQKKRARADEDDADEEALLTTTDGVLDARKERVLEKGTIAVERLRDANVSARAEGAVRTVAFHPSPAVPVCLVASADRRLRLFNIDGHTNPHLATAHIPSLPLTHACFHPGGTQILLTGANRPFYYTYDLQTGAAQRSPRGLWATDAPTAVDTAAFSPDGALLAVAGARGTVHLLDWRAGGAQVVRSFKGVGAGGVQALAWTREGAVRVLGTDAEVFVWDVRGGERCVRRWKDESAYGARCLEGDRAGRWTALGSATGYVNVYSSADEEAGRTKSHKAIGNLTTAISSMRFNHDAQLLAIASDAKKDQMRLVHTPSLTVYSNWPTAGTPLGKVTSVDFSAGSEYVAVGNERGRVLLYALRHYAQGV